MKRFILFVLLIALFLAGLYAWTQRRHGSPPAPASYTPAAGTTVPMKDAELLAAIDRAYTGVVDAALPSVVSITTSRRVNMGYVIDPYELLQNHRLMGVPKQEDRLALGSGVIISREGHILTNYHVVADTNKIQVELNDGRVEPAEVIGTDPDTDIAVLKINAANVRPLPIGNSDEVKVGQVVFAVGNPLGLQETVTRGIISAKSRVVDDSSLEYFQTDAAINEGNSGGPLVNLRGEIIGINTRVATQNGGPQPQGLSFAIPANVARRTLEAILKNGRVVHSYLGVVINPLPPQIAAQMGINASSGALVTGVLPGSPAEKSGLKNGDVVTQFNGRDIASIREFHNRVVESPVGAKIQLGVIRADRTNATLTAEIIAQPENLPALQAATPAQAQAATNAPRENLLAGLKVAEIPADARPNLPNDVKGIMITAVDPASRIGRIPGTLQAGDVIEEINHLPVGTVADYEQVAAQLGPDSRQALFFICRGKARSFIMITTP